MTADIHAEPAELIDDVIDRIETIRTDLSRPGSDPATGLAVPKVPHALVTRLKYSVDQLRLFLWAYMDSWAQGASSPESRLQRIRMEAAADILSRLTKDFSTTGVPASREAHQLAEQLRAIASVMVDIPRKESS